MNLQISYNWIKEYLKTDKSAKEFAREFSLKSQTIDHVIPVVPTFKKVITAKILEISKHPNADKLQLAKINTGKSKFTVVCGAPNIAVGQIVPYAQIGATVIDSRSNDKSKFVIKKVKIRDVESSGMLCSRAELGLGDDHSGIMILAGDTPLGKPLESVLAMEDFLFDIEITSNRPDAMSVIGLAREGAAAVGGGFISNEPKPNLKVSQELKLQVEVEDKKNCPRYQAVAMTDVKVGPSPEWMQMRLIQAGFRPINNVVDITNYVAVEYGQPIHVFDYDKLQGKKIVVRKANKGEKILALDGINYQLSPDNLVIADAKDPIAIAGVMGGEKSSATEKTTNIVFEAANFNQVSIRKTARKLNVHSDSSSRFEKGLQPQATALAVARCMELAQQIAGAKTASAVLDIYSQDQKTVVVELAVENIPRYLGVEIKDAEVKKILESLDFEVSGSLPFKVVVPWWRQGDVTEEHDLIEEVARIYGYHNIPSAMPDGQIPLSFKDGALVWESKIKHDLAAIGFTEVYNYSMVSKDILKLSKTPLAEAIRIDNPLNESLEYMRVDLLPQILQNVSANINNFSEQKIFELSNVYIPAGNTKLPEEQAWLCGAIVGGQDVFRQAKGVAERLLQNMGIAGCSFAEAQSNYWHDKGKALEVKKGSKVLGRFGLAKQSLVEPLGIEKPMAIFDFNFSAMVGIASNARQYQAIPEFPIIKRDLSILIDGKISWEQISRAIAKVDALIVGVDYLDTFTDAKLGKSNKSVTLRLTMRAKDRTLKSEEADKSVEKAVKKLEQLFKASLR